MLRGGKLDLFRFSPSNGELKELATDVAIHPPACTPDGKWVFYVMNGEQQIGKASTEGGNSMMFVSGWVGPPVVAHDGRQIAYSQTTGQGSKQQRQYVIQSIDGGPPIRTIPEPDPTRWIVGWSPDDRALLIANEIKGAADNLFLLPIAGGKPTAITHFSAEPFTILSVAMSPEGKKLPLHASVVTPPTP